MAKTNDWNLNAMTYSNVFVHRVTLTVYSWLNSCLISIIYIFMPTGSIQLW